jgi:hypothetical protein
LSVLVAPIRSRPIKLLAGQGEQVGEIGDEARVDELDDARCAQAFDVELVAAGRVGQGGHQVAVASVLTAPALLAGVDAGSAARTRLGDGDGLFVAGAQVGDGGAARRRWWRLRTTGSRR